MCAVFRLENRDRTGLILRLMQRLGKPFSQLFGGAISRAENLLLTISHDSISIDRFPRSNGRLARSAANAAANPPTCNHRPGPQGRTKNCSRLPLSLCDARIAKHVSINGNRRNSGNCQGESRVFLDDKCCSIKELMKSSLRSNSGTQLFFLSIFRLTTISLRLSREETLRTGDFAPSNSACTS